MQLKWLSVGTALLLGGCASVEMAQYSVTSFPEVALKASEKKPANLKFVSNDDVLAPLVGALKSEFGKRKDFRVVDDAADYWFVLGGAQQYLKGKAHKRHSVAEQDAGNGGSEVVVAEELNLASAAKNVSVAVYETKTLAPVHYFEIPLYSGDNSKAVAKGEDVYAAAFSKDVVERIMDVFLLQQKDVETPVPLKADAELRKLFKARDYRGFLLRYRTLGCIKLEQYCEAMRKVEVGEADDADKALAKDAEVRFANYYLYLLVREALVMKPEKLEKTLGEHLRILESCKEDGIVESCPVALSRLEYKLSNVSE